jgi:hypothetical protein
MQLRVDVTMTGSHGRPLFVFHARDCQSAVDKEGDTMVFSLVEMVDVLAIVCCVLFALGVGLTILFIKELLGLLELFRKHPTVCNDDE